MALNAGTRLGPYEIQNAIGAGGMGEIYRAHDTRLNRTVAIKVMPPHFADDPEMKQRFDREAQTIAGLSHPNICTLHDIGEASVPRPAGGAPETVSYLVLEYLEGQTLADRLAGKRSRFSTIGVPPEDAAAAPESKVGESGVALGLDEALRIGISIADALTKAHRQGIVHRDLKPANVMLVRSPGAPALVKLLDFGLAKWTAPAGQDPLAALPTRADVTAPGMILGTLQYMAPEQVEGKDADARTDIFAFGALLYEMVTGKRAFQGRSQATLISAIMTGEPAPLASHQPLTPPALQHVVTRCLAKDPDDRWQDAHSLLVELQWIARSRTEGEAPAAVAADTRRRNRLLRIALISAAVLIAALSMPAVLYLRGPDPPEPFLMRVPVLGLSQANIAVSPDGRALAIVAQAEGLTESLLYVRAVHAPTFRELAGTVDAEQPFWSPDSRSIAFVSGGMLKRVEAAAGAAKNIGPVGEFHGGTWSEDDVIVFGSDKGLFRVSAQGGTPEPLTTVAAPETGHFWPWFLPDGRRFLFLSWSADPSARAIHLGTLESKDRTRIMSAGSNVAYVSPGYLIFHRERALFAQRFDVDDRALRGDPVQLVSGLSVDTSTGRGVFSASDTGVLAFFQSSASVGGRGQTTTMEFSWVSRDGLGRQVALEAGEHGDIDVSPDERYIAVTKQDPSTPGSDIWVVDWAKGIQTRLTQDPADDLNPVWSDDGNRIAFTTYRNGNADIFVRNANGVGPETPLVATPADEFVEAWSRDGKYLAYLVATDRFQDIDALPLEKGGKPFAVVQGPNRKDEPQFSYDGKWLAYTSDESSPGQFEVYVISFPDAQQKRRISRGGGGQPRWGRSSKELFYRTVTHYMVVDFTPGARIDSGVPSEMFERPTRGGGNTSASDPVRHQWAAASDGQRFLVRVPPGTGRRGQSTTPTAANNPSGAPAFARGRGQSAPSIKVMLHWPAVMEKK